ncbi:SLC13 family permease [Pacificimonas flava]|uniref:TrkA-C n=1 Tax=Pacificimonas flava TaxID=1234595 RepID=M2SDV0_9SPHN|nr:SLC13 family permease [Pacificimonas flava]EMD83540.1 TrkA-C [Pacificimonas flava]MBB5278909.1 di/tricarboxylate transporter [Pacificimonas flava]
MQLDAFNTLSAFVDAHSALIGLLVLLAILAGFISERLPPVVIAVAGGAVMLMLGFLTPERLAAVFSNPAPITIAAMFILSGALVRTGVVDAMAAIVSARADKNPRFSMVQLMGGTFTASSLVNNTPVVIVLIPIMKRTARAAGIAARRMLIPLSYISILGGSMTLLGTSTNLLVDGIAQRSGLAAFTIFEPTLVGAVTAIAGILTLSLLGPFLLPGHDTPRDAAAAQEDEQNRRLYITDLVVEEGSRLDGLSTSSVKLLKRDGLSLIAVQRKTRFLRGDQLPVVLDPGDRLILEATETELVSLTRDATLRPGVGTETMLTEPNFISATISPSHPTIGRQLSEIPFLSRLPVRVVGLSRPRHMAGPSLSQVRIRAGDRLLIAADSVAASALRANINLVEVGESQARPFRRLKAPIAILTMLGIIALAAMGAAPIETLAIMGVAIVLLTRCIDAEEAWQSIDGNVLVLIFAMLAVGLGLRNAGTVELIVGWTTPTLLAASPFAVLLIVYALTSALTEVVTNNAVAVLMAPLVIALADPLGADVRALLLTVMFAASASFATPVGYQTNTLVYAAGGYRFTDFLKIGLPMNLIVGLATCTAIYFLY